MLQNMVLELTIELKKWGLHWKEESLKTTGWGKATVHSFQIGNTHLMVRQVDTLPILGIKIPNDGNPYACQE